MDLYKSITRLLRNTSSQNFDKEVRHIERANEAQKLRASQQLKHFMTAKDFEHERRASGSGRI